MKLAAMLLGLFSAAAIQTAAADQAAAASSALLDELQAACQTDAQNLCPGCRPAAVELLLAWRSTGTACPMAASRL